MEPTFCLRLVCNNSIVSLAFTTYFISLVHVVEKLDLEPPVYLFIPPNTHTSKIEFLFLLVFHPAQCAD